MSYKPRAHKAPITATIPAAKSAIQLSVFDALPDSAFIRDAYFSPSWTAFQAERGRDFSVIVDGISN